MKNRFYNIIFFFVISCFLNAETTTSFKRPNTFVIRSIQAGSTNDIDNLKITDLDKNEVVYENTFTQHSDATRDLILHYYPTSYKDGDNHEINGQMTRVVNGKLRLETTGFKKNGKGGYDSVSDATYTKELPHNFLVEFDAQKLQWSGHFRIYAIYKNKGDTSANLAPSKNSFKGKQVKLGMYGEGNWFNSPTISMTGEKSPFSFSKPSGNPQKVHRYGMSINGSEVCFFIDGKNIGTADLHKYLSKEKHDPTPPKENPSPSPINDNDEHLTFRHSVKHLNQEDVNDYLIEKNNIKKYSEWQNPPITYFGPSSNNKEGILTYKYSVDGIITSAKVKIKLDTWNFNAGGAFGSGSGEASAWISKDGIEWVNLIDIKTPNKLSESKTFHDQLPNALLGQKDLFLQIRMKVQGAPNSSYTVAQFCRSSANSKNEVFYVELKYSNGLDSDTPPAPPSTGPGKPPADDYQETIAGLEEHIEQLMADLNAANEEISQKDETIAGLQSTNQELADENEDLRGELVEEVKKNDGLTIQVANLTQENNTLNHDLEVKTEELEQAVEMAQVPFINGWVYDNDRGWMFTDADHYPMIYTHKDDTWHYFELGSNPRFFFNFTSQQWEAWDTLPGENDSNLADSNNL